MKITNSCSAITENAQVFQDKLVQPFRFSYITVAVPTEATGCSKVFAKEGKTAASSQSENVELLSHLYVKIKSSKSYIKKAVNELYLLFMFKILLVSYMFRICKEKRLGISSLKLYIVGQDKF